MRSSRLSTVEIQLPVRKGNRPRLKQGFFVIEVQGKGVGGVLAIRPSYRDPGTCDIPSVPVTPGLRRTPPADHGGDYPPLDRVVRNSVIPA